MDTKIKDEHFSGVHFKSRNENDRMGMNSPDFGDHGGGGNQPSPDDEPYGYPGGGGNGDGNRNPRDPRLSPFSNPNASRNRNKSFNNTTISNTFCTKSLQDMHKKSLDIEPLKCPKGDTRGPPAIS